MRLFAIVIFLWCWPALSCQWPSLTFLVGVEKPPYIDVATQKGFELELLQRVSLKLQRCAVFLHTPNGRLLDLFNKGQADFVSLQRTVPAGYFATRSYINYENILITRLDLKPQLQSLHDLAGKRVMAFQNAHIFLPKAYAEKIPEFASYLEVVEQDQLPALLLKNRVDVLVMDKNIFEYFYHKTAPDDASLKQHPLFGINSYHLLGRDAWLVERFDKALLTFQQSDEYQQLQLKYFQHANQPEQASQTAVLP
ncbi:substrate-binding periplasmic protein [Rheinheimera baltica]|uniref:substrate-binding periplasmic protein n=1 Tax=Rheinheimera baltica TaxID=67576 RepID=UPI00273D74CE|nr:transporter substrate-binding domain-containing protein [Rheinheimera baltica]MDP5150529.1 transporter substrate-binding domain-containing protein [Rheinheimera baltica]